MHAGRGPIPAKKLGDGKTVRGMVIDPAIAGLEKGGGVPAEIIVTMLRRGEYREASAIGRAASKALWDITNDTSVEKSYRKSAAGMLLGIMEKEMPVEDVAMCLLLVGYPRESEVAKIDSPKVDAVLKNILLNADEEQEVRARAALALKERGFAGFERPDDNACYLFFTSREEKIPSCGLAAVPFLLERLRKDQNFSNKIIAARLLGEISDLCPEPYDWRDVVKTLRSIAESQDERRVPKDMRHAASCAFKRITGVFPSQGRDPSTTGPAED
ncbi:hypothetical protein H0O01_02640 [Candidatus Micrarchaeota archaeon]|nr:hypothetical protein [Candidatus Micrarchaeota archaeon]